MKEYSFTSHWIDIKECRMHYLDEGVGRPVVMLHGNPTWSFYFRKLVSRLSKKYRCIVPDHIGCGYSDKPQNYPYRLQSHIDNCNYLLESLEVEEFDLIVHDWGGAIGMGVAVKNPERVNKIVIMNSAAFRSDLLPLRISICKIPVLGEFIVRRLNLFLKAARYMGTSKPAGLDKETWQGYLLPYNNYENRIAIHRFIKDIPMKPSHASYSILKYIEDNLKCLNGKPVFIVWGSRDFCFTDKFFNRWLEFFPGARTAKFQEASHFVLEDKSKEVVEAIDEFLGNDDGN